MSSNPFLDAVQGKSSKQTNNANPFVEAVKTKPTPVDGKSPQYILGNKILEMKAQKLDTTHQENAYRSIVGKDFQPSDILPTESPKSNKSKGTAQVFAEELNKPGVLKTAANIAMSLTSPAREIVRPFATIANKTVSTPWGEVKPLGAEQFVGLPKKENTATAGDAAMGAIDTTLGTGVPVFKTPLTKAAEKLYQSALKPSEEALKQGVIKTALKEKVWLTSGGVEKVASRIDDMENSLGKAIEEGRASGQKINTEGLKVYLDEAKKFFADHFDPAVGEKSVKEIDDIEKRFLGKHGAEIPIEEAQKIKVATGQSLRKYYGELTGAAQEASKQGTRFLKDAIAEKAPKVGKINERLKSLYQLNQALEKAGKRIGNLNLLGLGGKIGLAAGGKPGAVIGFLADLADKPYIKSGVAIGLNELGKLGAKGQIPFNTLIKFIAQKLQEQNSTGNDAL